MSTQDYDQPPEPQSYQPEFAKQEPELGLLETCVSVITEPVDTLRECHNITSSLEERRSG